MGRAAAVAARHVFDRPAVGLFGAVAVEARAEVAHGWCDRNLEDFFGFDSLGGGRGDGPITGSRSYVDSDVGGCGATCDGDIMMRFLPCYQAVENLRQGMDRTEAAEDAVRRMLRKYPDMSSRIVVVDKEGDHGGAGSGWTFTYAHRGGSMNATEVVEVPPVEL
ncbi:hypothetical protein HK405_010816 [Cladochytrium tenue]|nr:hypothetical protein HK405_010816 [Cladochytrium tenue]